MELIFQAIRGGQPESRRLPVGLVVRSSTAAPVERGVLTAGV
jgi:hypothetical protein